MHVMSLDLPNLHRGHYPPKVGILRSTTYPQVHERSDGIFLISTNFQILFISGKVPLI